MVGSAQLRRRGAVLQHGSILLAQEQTILPELLGDDSQVRSGSARHANLFEVTGRTVTTEELERAFKFGFESAFDAELVEGELTEGERDLAARLQKNYEVTEELAYTL